MFKKLLESYFQMAKCVKSQDGCMLVCWMHVSSKEVCIHLESTQRWSLAYLHNTPCPAKLQLLSFPKDALGKKRILRRHLHRSPATACTCGRSHQSKEQWLLQSTRLQGTVCISNAGASVSKALRWMWGKVTPEQQGTDSCAEWTVLLSKWN